MGLKVTAWFENCLLEKDWIRIMGLRITGLKVFVIEKCLLMRMTG